MKKKTGLVVLLIAVFCLWLGIASAGELTNYWITDSDRNPLYQIWQEGDWWYYYESEEGSTLYQYRGSETAVTLPDAFDGKPIINFLSQATRNFESITVPGSISVIPDEIGRAHV